MSRRKYSHQLHTLVLSLTAACLLAGCQKQSFPETSELGATNPQARLDFELSLIQPAEGVEIPYEHMWQMMEAQHQKQAFGFSGRLSSVVPTTAFTERGPSNVGGRTRTVLWDPDITNKVWAGSISGGLWFTTDITTDGVTWTKVNDFWDNLAVSTLAYDPTTSGGSRVYYAGTGEGYGNSNSVRGAGIFKSSDGGGTWARLSSTITTAFEFVQKIVVTDNGTVLAATRSKSSTQTDGGLFRSTDGGSNWTKVLGTTDATNMSLSPRAVDIEIAANGAIYASMGLLGVSNCDGVYKSTDDGVTWTKQTLPDGGTCDYERIEIATAPSDANTVYVATQSGSTNEVNYVFKTTNGGTTWTPTALPSPSGGNQAWFDLILAVDPNNADIVWLGVVRMDRTIDGGASWTREAPLPFHVDHHAIAYKPGSSDEIVFGNDGGVYYTNNATASKRAGAALATPTTVDRNDNYNVTQFYTGDMHPASGSNVMLAGSQDNGIHRFSSAGFGATTKVINGGGDGAFVFIDDETPSIAIGSSQNGRYRQSTDGGISFTFFYAPDNPLFINPTAYDDANNILYGTFSSTQIFYCTDTTTTPVCNNTGAITNLTRFGSTYKVSHHAAANTSVVFVGTRRAQLYRCVSTFTSNWSEPTCTDITPTGTGYPPTNTGTPTVSSIDIGASENEILLTISNFGHESVWETRDGGTTWHDRDDNNTLPDIPVRAVLYDPNNSQRVLIGTDAGLYGTDNINVASPIWARDTSIPQTRVSQLAYRPSDGTIMAVTHGRGIWTGSFSTELPVELARFEALQDGNDVLLSWTTTSETNNAGFEIERAARGVRDYETVAFVEGYGTTRTERQYAYRVANTPPGTYRFRLKQIDFDGVFEYSDALNVTIETPDVFALSPAYPNPLNTQTNFTLALNESQHVDVALYDMLGRQVDLLHSGVLEAHITHRFSINAAGLASGQYLYRVTSESFTTAKSIQVVR